jgi:peroxiredoxin
MLGPVVRKGDVVTDFELPDETGAPRRLSGLLAGGPVVLFFYPAAVSLGCTVESCHFRDLIGEFRAVGAQPVGISADRGGAAAAKALRLRVSTRLRMARRMRLGVALLTAATVAILATSWLRPRWP